MEFGARHYPAPGKVDVFDTSRPEPNFSAMQMRCRSQARVGGEPVKHTLNPMVTGTSILGVVFDGGVAVAADKLGSYGAMARFPGISRITKVNSDTVLAASGDYADFQSIRDDLEAMMIENDVQNDGHGYNPESIFAFLRIYLYQRRSKFNPLWNTLIVAGCKQDKPFLGLVDKLGMAYTEKSLATGYGAYIARPLMEKTLKEKDGVLTKEEAVELLSECMAVLYYRDGRSIDKYEIAITTNEGVTVETNLKVKTDWNLAYEIQPL